MRGYLVTFTFIGALAFSACSSIGSVTPTTTLDDCRNLRPNHAPACAYTVSPTTESRIPAPHTPSPAPPTRTPTPNAATVAPPASTAAATAIPSGASGIEGTVTIGPTCPVQRIDSPCPDRPYDATVSVLDATGVGVLASVRSGSDGRFRVLLPAGRYLVRSESETALSPRAFEEMVDVEPGHLTPVQIVFDSGIR